MRNISSKKYIPELDGIRAIAVFLVILAHIGFTKLAGGFIGVDMFFVLSGYLISSIIIQQTYQNKFSFSEFYKRRIKRLFPALFTTAFVVLIIGFFLFLPSDFKNLAKAGISAITYLANIYHWQQSSGYFAADAKELPFLHTWSLAVEWQFYMVWPILLFLMLKYFSNKRLMQTLAIAIPVLLIASEYMVMQAPSFAYFSLLARFVEFLFGAYAFIWQTSGKLESIYRNKKLSEAFCIAGYALIISSALFLNNLSDFPGLNLLYPCLGTALLIVFAPHAKLGLILRSKIFVWLGLISYSLYLWHWPIISFMNYSGVGIKSAARLVIIFSSISLAALTYYFIEKPLRYGVNDNLYKTILSYFIIPLLVLILLYYYIVNDVLKNPNIDEVQLKKYEALSAKLEYPNIAIKGWCHVSTENDFGTKFELKFAQCNYNKNANSKAILFGDSHAGHFAPFVKNLAEKYDFAVNDLSVSGCTPLVNSEIQLGSSPDVCRNFRKIVAEKLISKKIDVIFIGISPRNWDELNPALDKSLAFMSSHAKKVILMLDIPMFKDNPNKYMRRYIIGLKKFDPSEAKNKNILSLRSSDDNSKLQELALKYQNVETIDVGEFLCNEDKTICSAFDDNGISMYKDGTHLNIYGSEKLSEMYIEKYFDKNQL